MKNREATVALAMLASLCMYATPSDGQDFLRSEKPSAPSDGAPCDTQFPSAVPIRCWVGQQFIVLPIDKLLRSYGYQDFKGGSGQYGFASYDELVGKTVTVTDVEWQNNTITPDFSSWTVTFRADDTGTTYTANAVILSNEGPDQATIDHLALVRDLKGARDRYLGKSFWMLSGWLPELGENGAISFSSVVRYKKFVPITVTDVLASYDANAPVRVVVKNASGQEGYFDMAMSGTNHRIGDVGDAALAHHLSTTDPKLGHKWPPLIWDAIENGLVIIGMSEEQGRMSWGEPREVNRTLVAGHVHEQWVYGDNKYLYVEDGRVTAIQD